MNKKETRLRRARKTRAKLAELKAVEERGVAIHSCGTCLDYYGIREQLRVGDGGTMAETIAALMSAQDAVVI